jgi:hypothetical protein
MSHLAADRFFDVPRTTRQTSEGPVELPILYYDVSNVIVLFTARLAGLRAVLADTRLEPVLAGPLHGVVGLSFYEYRETTVGVYNEVGTAIFCVREGERSDPLTFAELLRAPAQRRLSTYVLDLPVTTAAANAAGREIWGYPKFVTPISFHLEGRDFDASVGAPDDSGDLCRITGRMGRGVPVPPLSLVTYSHLDGALVRTHIDVRGPVMARAPGSLRLEVSGSRHAMAAHLRSLGLEGARPFLALTTYRFQSILHEGVTLR